MISPISYINRRAARTPFRLMLPLLMLASVSCGSDSVTALPDIPEDTEPYVLLRIALPSGYGITRSDPAGGEEGNGREEGILNEDKLHDITVFFYRDEKGLDGDDDTPIIQSVFFNLDDPDDEHNTPFSDKHPADDGTLFSSNYLELAFDINDAVEQFGEGIRFAAVANIGYIGNAVTNLKQLRELPLGTLASGFSTVSTPAKTMDRFPMSTAYNNEYMAGNRSTGKNMIEAKKNSVTKKSVFTGTTTLERLYARVDLWYNSTDNAGVAKDNAITEISRLSYPVNTATGAYTGNKVILTNVIPVNVMQSPSYLFKKVTALDPNATDLSTITWSSDFLSSVGSFSWAGKETPDGIPNSMPNDLPTNYVVEPTTLLKSPSAAGDLAGWYGTTALDVAKTTIREETGTGLISGYYSTVCEKGVGDPDYGCDRVSIITYANENTHPVDCFLPQYLTGLAIRSLYIPANIYKYYSPAADGSEEAFVELTEEEKSNYDLNFSIYRYSPSSGNQSELSTLYFSRIEALEEYQKAHQDDNPLVTQYSVTRTDGELGLICFYNLWLRHYNDETANPQKDYPMEYAIVRNNIYRVALEFTGPGHPEPEMRETDSMMARIFVRKWNKRTESSPLQF